MLAELIQRIEALEKTLGQIVRVGKVTSVFPSRGTVRVALADADDMITNELPVLFRKTLKDRDYSMPDIEEQVLCVFLPNGLEQGFVIGAMYSKADTVPVTSKDKWYVEFADGTKLEYDRAAHKLSADVQGDVEITATGNCSAEVVGDVELTAAGKCNVITAGPATVAAPQITLDSPLIESKGGFVKLGSDGTLQKLIDARFLEMFNAHVHSGVTPGVGQSGPPTTLLGAGHMTTILEAS